MYSTQMKLAWLGATAVAGFALLPVLGANAPTDHNQSVDQYLNTRQSVLDCLEASLAHDHAYTDTALAKPKRHRFSWPESAKSHLRHALLQKQYDGQHVQKFLVVLPIDPTKTQTTNAATNAATDSLTMEATQILNHYMNPLKQVGLECRGTPMAAISTAQYAAKTWIPTSQYERPQVGDIPVWVETEVFYAPCEKTAIMRITVGGRYSPRRS